MTPVPVIRFHICDDIGRHFRLLGNARPITCVLLVTWTWSPDSSLVSLLSWVREWISLENTDVSLRIVNHLSLQHQTWFLKQYSFSLDPMQHTNLCICAPLQDGRLKQFGGKIWSTSIPGLMTYLTSKIPCLGHFKLKRLLCSVCNQLYLTKGENIFELQKPRRLNFWWWVWFSNALAGLHFWPENGVRNIWEPTTNASRLFQVILSNAKINNWHDWERVLTEEIFTKALERETMNKSLANGKGTVPKRSSLLDLSTHHWESPDRERDGQGTHHRNPENSDNDDDTMTTTKQQNNNNNNNNSIYMIDWAMVGLAGHDVKAFARHMLTHRTGSEHWNQFLCISMWPGERFDVFISQALFAAAYRRL